MQPRWRWRSRSVPSWRWCGVSRDALRLGSEALVDLVQKRQGLLGRLGAAQLGRRTADETLERAGQVRLVEVTEPVDDLQRGDALGEQDRGLPGALYLPDGAL